MPIAFAMFNRGREREKKKLNINAESPSLNVKWSKAAPRYPEPRRFRTAYPKEKLKNNKKVKKEKDAVHVKNQWNQ